jgi:hypothetical protein
MDRHRRSKNDAEPPQPLQLHAGPTSPAISTKLAMHRYFVQGPKAVPPFPVPHAKSTPCPMIRGWCGEQRLPSDDLSGGPNPLQSIKPGFLKYSCFSPFFGESRHVRAACVATIWLCSVMTILQ